MPEAVLHLPERRRFAQTSRRDAWWLAPFATLVTLIAFIVYATWAALQGSHYEWGPYSSPFYSPQIFGPSPHAWLGPIPSWWPGWLPFSPAIFILWVPVGFRLSCYYWRGAYYKSFWSDPPSCAVGEPRKTYRGENSFPLILQNVHRYFLYLALLFIAHHTWDVWKAMWFADPSTGGEVFGLGVGTLVLAVDVVLLSGYVFGCHSLRHLVGGSRDELCENPVRKRAYGCVSCLNRRHMLWAWISLAWVAFADLYVRLCSMGIWSDWRIF